METSTISYTSKLEYSPQYSPYSKDHIDTIAISTGLNRQNSKRKPHKKKECSPSP